MESLLANYASSDDEEHHHPSEHLTKPTASFFSSLPPPKSSSSLFSSLPKPKPKQSTRKPKPNSDSSNQLTEDQSKHSSIFSSLTQPKSLIPQQPISNKRVVQFRVPIIPPSRNLVNSDDEDEENERKERRRREESASVEQAPSVTSFLSSIPAPRNSSTLGVISTSGSARRSIVETETPAEAPSVSSTDGFEVVSESRLDQNLGNYDAYANYESGVDQNIGQSVNYSGSYEYNESGISQSYVGNTTNYGNNDTYAGYEHYGNNWDAGSITTRSMTDDNALRVLGKRGRNGIPTDIVEVKQDELIKNRPREDQVKLTGIAFGPSYQPVSTSKGKPSKLHKRKHQIGTLYFEMKQKEMELSERRAKGFLTKAETQAKYGW